MCMTCSIGLERSSIRGLQALNQSSSFQVQSVVIPEAWSIHGEAGIVLCSSDSTASLARVLFIVTTGTSVTSL